MPRPWLKICGLREPQMLRQALHLGARYVGVVVEVPRSPRSLDLAAAEELLRVCPERTVVVVQDLPAQRLEQVLAVLRPGAVQLHGAEPPELVQQLRRDFPFVQVWKALGIAPEVADLTAAVARLSAVATEYLAAGAEVVALDSRTSAGFGGTGQTANWEVAAAVVLRLACPVVLAGGLSAENLRAAAQVVQPAGLDVSSGVETAPGRKSLALLEELFAQWRSLPDMRSGNEIP